LHHDDTLAASNQQLEKSYIFRFAAS